MNIGKLLNAAGRSILRNRMRSLLTMLGIIIGVGAVIVMVAIGQGAQQEIEQRISSLGTNVIMVFPNSSRTGGISQGAGTGSGLTLKDVESIQETGSLIAQVSPVVRSGGQVIGGGNNWSASIQGVAPNYIEIRDWPLQSGLFFTERDNQIRGKVAVLGATVARELFGDQNPVGAEIRIGNTPFSVIGVLTEKGQSANGGDQDDIILAPFSTVLYRLSGGRRTINQMYLSAISTEAMVEAQQQVENILRLAHKLQPGSDDDFVVRTQSEITEAASATTETLTLLLSSIAGVSLIVGGIGIMNIMLVSVTERTREIGIRMAVGARASDVLAQFLVESIVLSLLGGIIGIALSLSVSFGLTEFAGLATAVDPIIVVISLAFSAAVGVFFGYYPARKAASLDPIQALRYE